MAGEEASEDAAEEDAVEEEDAFPPPTSESRPKGTLRLWLTPLLDLLDGGGAVVGGAAGVAGGDGGLAKAAGPEVGAGGAEVREQNFAISNTSSKKL